ncbi:hypothetical protein AVEN_215106-1, partial [Araneus ventricosus]
MAVAGRPRHFKPWSDEEEDTCVLPHHKSMRALDVGFTIHGGSSMESDLEPATLAP